MEQKFAFLKKLEEYKKKEAEKLKQQEEQKKQETEKPKVNTDSNQNTTKNFVYDAKKSQLIEAEIRDYESGTYSLKSSCDTITLFAVQGGNPNMEDSMCNSILHHLARTNQSDFYKYIDYIKVLMNYGADINKCNLYDKTPLHYAVENNNLDMVKFLVEKGANINAKTNAGFTALDIAKNYKLNDLIEYLELLEQKNDIENEYRYRF